jgi:hypothetical protein
MDTCTSACTSRATAIATFTRHRFGGPVTAALGMLVPVGGGSAIDPACGSANRSASVRLGSAPPHVLVARGSRRR